MRALAGALPAARASCARANAERESEHAASLHLGLLDVVTAAGSRAPIASDTTRQLRPSQSRPDNYGRPRAAEHAAIARPSSQTGGARPGQEWRYLLLALEDGRLGGGLVRLHFDRRRDEVVDEHRHRDLMRTHRDTQGQAHADNTGTGTHKYKLSMSTATVT